MVSDSLWAALADAYSQPSKAYKAAELGLGAVEKGVQGYLTGQEIGDKLRKRKLQQQTLSQVLGGSVPEGLDGFKDARIDTLKEIAEPVQQIAALNRSMEGEPMFLSEEQSKMTGGAFAPFSRVSPRRFVDAVRAFRTGQPKPADPMEAKLGALENERKAIDARLRSADANFGIGIDPDELNYLKTRRSALDNEIRKQAGLQPVLPLTAAPAASPAAVPVQAPLDEKVVVIDGNGKRFKLPKSQLQEAQRQGYRLAQ